MERELNREKIVIEIGGLIKALKANNGWWENRGRGGWFNHDILEDALTLITSQEQRIKELTEENERLHASCTELTQECKKWQGRVKIECEYTKAATVREMQKRLTSFFEADDIVRFNEVDADYINEQINEIANKLLEEK